MIEVHELTRRFGSVLAVDRLSFAVAAGEVLGFLGPNGAGKTTTMKIITAFLAPSAGSVHVFGNDVRTAAVAARARIGYLPEGAPLYGDMTPRQLLRFATRLRALSGPYAAARIDFAIQRLGLASVADARSETLSKGFRRRVAIALAIVHDPDVLILDEPTDGLDPNQKHEVRTLIRELSPGRIIVVSTHILEEVDAVCTRAVIIGEGRLLADATPRELAARSRYHGAVTIEFAAPPTDIEVLAEIGSGTSVDPDAPARITVFPRRQTPPDAAVGSRPPRPTETRSLFDTVRQLAAERRWALTGLYVEQGRLDEVFRALTTAPATTAPAAADHGSGAPGSADRTTGPADA